jgi:hypothetical protein
MAARRRSGDRGNSRSAGASENLRGLRIAVAILPTSPGNRTFLSRIASPWTNGGQRRGSPDAEKLAGLELSRYDHTDDNGPARQGVV